jgi:hypothetical protein
VRCIADCRRSCCPLLLCIRVWQLAAAYPEQFVPVCSVHPYRKDAVAQLELWASRGARVCKWLPNSYVLFLFLASRHKSGLSRSLRVVLPLLFPLRVLFQYGHQSFVSAVSARLCVHAPFGTHLAQPLRHRTFGRRRLP